MRDRIVPVAKRFLLVADTVHTVADIYVAFTAAYTCAAEPRHSSKKVPAQRGPVRKEQATRPTSASFAAAAIENYLLLSASAIRELNRSQVHR